MTAVFYLCLKYSKYEKYMLCIYFYIQKIKNQEEENSCQGGNSNYEKQAQKLSTGIKVIYYKEIRF